MALAKLEENGRAYFSTSLDSPKMQELAANPHAVATFQKARQFASLSGTITVSRDAALIDSLWSEDWRVWFPGGKTDPTLCILILDGTEGEYWDRAGMRAISYIFSRVGAALEGKGDTVPKEQHAKLEFGGDR